MNDRIDPVFYGFICAALLWLATLWLVMRFRTRECSRGLKAAFGVATVLMLFVPIAGSAAVELGVQFLPESQFAHAGCRLCGVVAPSVPGSRYSSQRTGVRSGFYGAIAGNRVIFTSSADSRS